MAARVGGEKPIVWLQRLRDDPDVTGMRLLVLVSLGLRMAGNKTKDWPVGTGYCSVDTLQADCGASRSVVLRVLRWAVQRGYLEQTVRGHALRNGRGKSSEWRLLEGATRDTFQDSESVTTDTFQPVDNLAAEIWKVSPDDLEGVSGDTPRELSNKRPHSSPQTRYVGAATYDDDRDPQTAGEALERIFGGGC